MESRAKVIAVRSAMAIGVAAGLLVVWYASMVATPTGFQAVVAERKAKWEKVTVRSVPAAGATPADAPAAVDPIPVASALGPYPQFQLSGPLGYMLPNKASHGFTFKVAGSTASRSTKPADWEPLLEDAVISTEAKIAREFKVSPNNDPPIPPTPIVDSVAELSRLETSIYGHSYTAADFDQHDVWKGYYLDAMVCAARWPILLAVVAGDRAKAARYLPVYVQLDLENHRTNFGTNFPRGLETSGVFLAMLAGRPGFPAEALPTLQAQFEAARMTPEQFDAMMDRWLVRSEKSLLKLVDDPDSRIGNTWHYFLEGGIEATVNAALLPGVRSELERYTKARLEKNVQAASSSAIKLRALWKLANISNDFGWSFQNYFDRNSHPELTSGYWFPEEQTRRMRYNWEIDKSIVLIAMLRYRADKGQLPRTGSDLVPEYLSQAYLDSTESAWRFTEDQDGPVLVRFDPAWVTLLPGGLDSATPEQIAAKAGEPQVFYADMIRDGWAVNSGEALKVLGIEGGS